MSDGGMQSLLISGAVVGFSAALLWKMNKRAEPANVHERNNRDTIENFRKSSSEHWSAETRFAVGAAGAALLLYGMRASGGKIARLASTAGAGLLARSVSDKPIHDWHEIIPTRTLIFS